MKEKNKSMKQTMQSLEAHSKNAEKTKANLISPSEKGFHEPNRPSI